MKTNENHLFESWFTHNFGKSYYAFRYGEYANIKVNKYWLGWIARASLANKQQ